MASVDVCIPSYNYARFLGDCIRSVQSQDIDNLRILIIDNASTDDSVAVASRFAADDRRIEIRARPVNLGPHASFNEGVDWAVSDYFMVLCADDRMAPGALRRAVRVLDETKLTSFAHGDTISVFQSRPADDVPQTSGSWTIIDGPDFIERFCRTGINHISGCTALVRTALQKKAGYYREHLPHTDDFELWMRLALLGPVAEIDAIQGISLIHGANLSAYYHAVQTRDLVAMKDAFDSFFSREGADMPRFRMLHRRSVSSIAERAYWSGVSHALRGHFRTSGALFRMAFRLRPHTAALPPLHYITRLERPLEHIGGVLYGAIAGSNRNGHAQPPAQDEQSSRLLRHRQL